MTGQMTMEHSISRRNFLKMFGLGISTAGLTGCMVIMGVGKYFLVPQQDWSVWFGNHPPGQERWFESLRTIATWFWIALFVGLPGLLQIWRGGKRTGTVLAQAGL